MVSFALDAPSNIGSLRREAQLRISYRNSPCDLVHDDSKGPDHVRIHIQVQL